MRKSEQYSVAIFFAVALFAGTLAGSAPAFVVDAQATEEKKYYKEKERHSDQNYRHDDDNRHDDRDNKYSKDRDDRHDDRDHTYSKDRDDGHDGDKSSVKYIKCNNVNINGKGGHSNGGNDNWPNHGGNDNWPNHGGNDNWPNDGGNDNWPGMGGGNDNWPRDGDSHGFPGFVKQTDKDVVVICIFNNDGKKKVIEPETCEECFLTIQQGGFIPRGQLMQILDELDTIGITIEQLCERIGNLDPEETTLQEIRNFVNTLTNNPNVQRNLAECLFEFVGEGLEDLVP